MANKILILTGDAGESYEALYALHRFQEAGYETTIAAPEKRRMHLVIHDFEPGWSTYVERPGYGLESDAAIADVSAGGYAAVVLLGGRAPEYLRHDPATLALVKAFDAAGKWIFSLCHGIQILVAAGLVRGKKVTCYEHCRYEAESGGAEWQTPEAVRDGRYVTGQTWESHPDFYRLVFQCLAE